MACAWLLEAQGRPLARPATIAGGVEADIWEQVQRLALSGLSSPPTTSIGRLFDAVAALCGLRTEINYEGQAAIELEAACDPRERGSYPIAVTAEPGPGIVIDPRETILAILDDLARGAGAGTVASRFHRAVASATVSACVSAASSHGSELVVLSGGVFANRRLLSLTADGLAAGGLRVLVPERLPAGDGGISYGQAAVAATRIGGARSG
jgi:hydrogenase maturation protein HypF